MEVHGFGLGVVTPLVLRLKSWALSSLSNKSFGNFIIKS